MRGEGRRQDYKLRFDPEDERGKVKLVKHIVAIANSGGGEIIFGRDETEKPGLAEDLLAHLDSAKIGDLVEKYVVKGAIHVSHSYEKLENGNYICWLEISEPVYPVVMEKDGRWSGFSSGDKQIFTKGDIWVRHGSRSERVAQSDVQEFIRSAYEKGVSKVLEAAEIVRHIAPDAAVEFTSGDAGRIRGPGDLLRLALSRRNHGLPYLLDGEELLWLFTLRRTFAPSRDELKLMIESALRRSPTLYWWISDKRVNLEMMRDILFRILPAEDRDKSDAANVTVELAAVFLEEDDLSKLLEELRGNRYAHFRRAAAEFTSRDDVIRSLKSRIERASHKGVSIFEMSFEKLDELADRIGTKAFKSSSSGHLSRKLGDITRAWWFRVRGEEFIGKLDG